MLQAPPRLPNSRGEQDRELLAPGFDEVSEVQLDPVESRFFKRRLMRGEVLVPETHRACERRESEQRACRQTE